LEREPRCWLAVGGRLGGWGPRRLPPGPGVPRWHCSLLPLYLQRGFFFAACRAPRELDPPKHVQPSQA